MGQYYIAALRRPNEKKFKTYMVDHGFKLTEHSYIGNFFMRGVCELLYKNPAYVVWCGDYYDEEEDEMQSYMSTDKVGYSGKELWHKKETIIQSKEFNVIDKFLVNHDTKEYICFQDYCDALMCGELMGSGWCVHPLSLMTVNSNGKGGGDYDGWNNDTVGAWRDCLISIEDEAPQEFKDVTLDCLFKETD